MGKLTRKNLMVDAGQLRDLARRRGTSESEAVRRAVEMALAADEVVEILQQLHDLGGVDDVFERLPPDVEVDLDRQLAERRSEAEQQHASR
jgi:hypothetical protein